MKQLPSIIYTNANLLNIMTFCCQKELMEISDEVHTQAFSSSITLSTLFDRTVTRRMASGLKKVKINHEHRTQFILKEEQIITRSRDH
jgi:hypothetical protein